MFICIFKQPIWVLEEKKHLLEEKASNNINNFLCHFKRNQMLYTRIDYCGKLENVFLQISLKRQNKYPSVPRWQNSKNVRKAVERITATFVKTSFNHAYPPSHMSEVGKWDGKNGKGGPGSNTFIVRIYNPIKRAPERQSLLH